MTSKNNNNKKRMIMDKLLTTACGLGPNFFLSACDAILAKKSPEKTILSKDADMLLYQKKAENKKQKI